VSDPVAAGLNGLSAAIVAAAVRLPGGDWLRWRGSTNMNVNTMVTSTITAPRWSRPKLAASISVSHRCSIARSEYEAEITGARSRSTFNNPNEGSVNSVDAATV